MKRLYYFCFVDKTWNVSKQFYSFLNNCSYNSVNCKFA